MTQRKNVDIGPVITMTRNAYRLVKIAPFVYAMIYMMCLFGYLAKTDKVKGTEKTPSPKPLPLSGYRPIPHFSGGCRNC